MFETLFLLLIGHAFADFALQTPAMANGKSPLNVPKNIPKGQKPTIVWPYYLSAHTLIHAGAVYVVTGSLLFALAEAVTHFFFDLAKSLNYTNPHIDQILHLLMKVLYAFQMQRL